MIRLLKLFIFFIAMILLAPGSWAGGSRIGNGNGSGGGDGGKGGMRIQLDPSFEVEAPIPFSGIKKYSDGIRIEGPPLVKNKRSSFGYLPVLESQKINLMNMKQQWPELSQLSQDQLLQHLEKNNWKASPTDTPCLMARYKESQQTITAVVSSGHGEGFVASADNTPETLIALKKIMQSAQSTKGCLWK